MYVARVNCFKLLRHFVRVAFTLALLSTGRSIAAKIAMMAITINNSIKVNPFRDRTAPARADKTLTGAGNKCHSRERVPGVLESVSSRRSVFIGSSVENSAQRSFSQGISLRVIC